MRQIAHHRIDRLNAAWAIHRALADIAASVNSQPQKHRRAAWPLVKQLARKIAAKQHRRHQPRRLGNAVVAAATRAVAT